MAILRLGIISQTLVQQHHLRHLIEECGYQVRVAWLIDHVLSNITTIEDAQNIDAWLIDVDTFSLDQTNNALLFRRWLFDLRTPVIFGEGTTYNITEAGFHSWSRQLSSKLMSLSGEVTAKTNDNKPSHVWVLAASSGGPEPIKKFLDRVPGRLGLAFLYAQHNQSRQNRTLVSTVTRESAYQGKIAHHGDKLQSNTVTVVPTQQELDILENGTLVIKNRAWRGEYKPSIDQVVATVAKRFGSRSGAIFFSGMGDDGVVGARLMVRRAGRVWIQSPATCAADLMPSAIMKTGCVSAVGSPEELASLIVSLLDTTRLTASSA